MAPAQDEVRWLDEVGLEDRPAVGGKAANLGALLRAGFPVPPGFVLTTAAFERALDESGVRGPVEAATERLSPSDLEAIHRGSRVARDLVARAPLPAGLAPVIAAACERLAGGAELSVAVRSSALDEDGDAFSAAGQLQTSLGVRGAESVARHVRLCWASLYTPRALAYRARMRAERGQPAPVSMGVVVQRMVDARVAGVMLTRSPLTGDPSVAILDASFGLGVGVVSGDVTPDEYHVDKVGRVIRRRRLGPKEVEVTWDPGGEGVHARPVPEERRREACLRDDEVLSLSDLGRRIEQLYGAAQDIEWALDRALPFPDNIVVLQSRPETAARRRDAAAAPPQDALGAVLRAVTGGRPTP